MILLLFAGSLLLAGPAAAGPRPPDQAVPSRPASAQAPQVQRPAGSPGADAYYQFLLGRHLESTGKIEEAIKAFREAARLDPTSAEPAAELAALFARASRLKEAIDTAEAALVLDPKNIEANRVLGFIYGSLSGLEDARTPPDADARAMAGRSIQHLEVARQTSTVPEYGVGMMLAQLYLRTGAYDKAAALLQRIVLEEPERAEPVGMLVEALERTGRASDAVRILEERVAASPQLNALLGERYERQQRFAEAASAFEKAVARNPKSLELKIRLATVWLSDGQPAQAGRALELLQQVQQASPADPRVLYLVAQAQRVVGTIDESEATARKLMTVAPGLTTGPYALALALEAKQQYRAIVEALEPVVARASAGKAPPGPELVPLMIRLASARYELGEFDQAIALFTRARAAAPGNTSIDVYVLQVLLSARRLSEAVELGRKVVAARPADMRALRLHAEALRVSGRVEEGGRLLADALSVHPEDPASHLALADFYAQSRQFDAAIRVLRGAATEFPTDPDITFQLGSVFERQQKHAEAERTFREVLAKDPLHAPALNYLGYMMADRGDRIDEAIGYIKRALQVEPYSGAYLDSLGWAYFKQNRLDLAEPNLRKAAEQRVRDSAVLDHYGELLFRLGRFKEAASVWQRALEGDLEQIDRAAVERKLQGAREKIR